MPAEVVFSGSSSQCFDHVFDHVFVHVSDHVFSGFSSLSFVFTGLSVFSGLSCLSSVVVVVVEAGVAESVMDVSDSGCVVDALMVSMV